MACDQGLPLTFYHTKELGVREARDKDALPLATGLPKRHLLLRSLRLSEALRDASPVNMAWSGILSASERASL